VRPRVCGYARRRMTLVYDRPVAEDQIGGTVDVLYGHTFVAREPQGEERARMHEASLAGRRGSPHVTDRAVVRDLARQAAGGRERWRRRAAEAVVRHLADNPGRWHALGHRDRLRLVRVCAEEGADRAEGQLDALLLTAAERQALVDLVRQIIAPREQQLADGAPPARALGPPRPRPRLASLLRACRGARTTSVPDPRPAGLPCTAVAGHAGSHRPFPL
jgi:hypothetical protein